MGEATEPDSKSRKKPAMPTPQGHFFRDPAFYKYDSHVIILSSQEGGLVHVLLTLFVKTVHLNIEMHVRESIEFIPCGEKLTQQMKIKCPL